MSVATPTAPANQAAQAKPAKPFDPDPKSWAAALNKAKIQLMATPDSAFFTTVCFSLKHVWSDKVSTAATDGRQILFNPKFFMGLNVKEQVFLLLHESMHVAFLHMSRTQGRNPRRANAAMDYVINLMLVDRGFTMPEGGLLDQKYANMCWEEVYDLLPEDPPGDRIGQDLMPSDSADPHGVDEVLAQEVQDILVRASIQSKMANDKPGTIPGDIQVFLDKLLNPKLPWNRIMAKYFNAFAKNDYSFKRPNRRFFPQHHLPSLFSTNLMSFAAFIDISGSVSDHDFNVFVSELHTILKTLKPAEITIGQFDTQLQHVDKVKSAQELLKLQFHGRGGTLIHPVMDWAVEHRPQLLLVFSDGEFAMPETKPPGTEVLWIIHNNDGFKPPFGKVIHYTI